MTKEQLELHKVDLQHLEQYNQLLKYVFQVTKHTMQKVGWEEKEFIKAKQPSFERASVLGWFDKDNLISQCVVYPMKVQIFGKVYEMGGLTGVGTYPEYSNQGLMHRLLEKALYEMREKGQYISYLYPYSIPYYRRKGWEIISDKITYEIQDYQLPKNRKVAGEVRRLPVTSPEIRETYNRFAACTHGALIRDDLAWNEYWLWDNDDITSAIYYNEKGEQDGYLIYWIADEVFHIKDMIFLNEEARIGLWNFVSAHFSMISKVVGSTFTDESLAFLLEDAKIQENISPYFMARIVDFEKFIASYPFKADTRKRSWTFTLQDPMLPWNQGTFTLNIDRQGKGVVERCCKRVRDKVDIQTMTTMLLGYKRPDYLNKIGRLACNDATVDMLEDAIEQQTPYFSDYF
ncbi:MAG: GNAT family N-acetyltransferase [Spirochaetaceae bacterium]|nr:GNAT family N-acetyltransferase [Spirochaetaceae bacterium]